MMSFWCSDNNVLHIPPGQQRAVKRSNRERQTLIAGPYLFIGPAWYCAWESCLLGVQSESDDACSHGGGEGGLWFNPAAALLWTQRYLSRTADLFSFSVFNSNHVLLHGTMLLFFWMVLRGPHKTYLYLDCAIWYILLEDKHLSTIKDVYVYKTIIENQWLNECRLFNL